MVVKNYFSTHYDRVDSYSPGWYGTRDKAPKAIILLYDDHECFCVGYMEQELPKDLTPLTEQQALDIVSKYQNKEKVFSSEKLLNRWKEKKRDEEGKELNEFVNPNEVFVNLEDFRKLQTDIG
jgi:hypothetical protein